MKANYSVNSLSKKNTIKSPKKKKKNPDPDI